MIAGPASNPAWSPGARLSHRITAVEKNTGDTQAVKKRMGILSDMEIDHKGPDGCKVTTSSAITEINETAKIMELLYKSVTTAKTHLSFKDKQ